jgi:predicted molibdopterin-dependent oxidoreductase YjgC
VRAPRTPNGIGVNHAVARAGAEVRGSEPQSPGAPQLLIVSGDEAAADPAVRALAESAGAVLVVAMYHGLAAGWADLVLPGTSYLERDGSMTNMEGRVQRLRRAVIPPAPDETAWLSRLAAGFDLDLSPYPAVVYEEIFGKPFSELVETAPLAEGTGPGTVPESAERAAAPGRGGLRLVRYRPLFSGPAVDRVENLQFQRPNGDVELSRDDALRLGIRDGDAVRVRTNGTSAELRATIRRGLTPGVVLLPEDAAEELVPGAVEVARA